MKMESDFMRMQREATEQLKRMNARAMLPTEPTKIQETVGKTEVKKTKQNEVPNNDMLILLLLLFLLYKDGADPVLMVALLYLLM
jgi:hypothetical protein